MRLASVRNVGTPVTAYEHSLGMFLIFTTDPVDPQSVTVEQIFSV